MVEPLDAPQALLTLCLRGHTFPPLDAPNLGLAVLRPAEKILAIPIPVKTHDPRAMTRQICDLLPTLGIVQRDDARISSCCQVSISWTELDGSHGLD